MAKIPFFKKKKVEEKSRKIKANDPDANAAHEFDVSLFNN
jgi:hypothetical protein